MESSINKGINYGIPLGMHRSVEQSIPHVLHPVRDASLSCMQSAPERMCVPVLERTCV
ncbi:MAG: hypothetical protein LBQ01_03875 [Prevotellaceae bacterium]|nr:hypothetical protein [Prevotellaceae bacterium]